MPHVLIVEDEAVLRMTFGQFLENEGHEVSTAKDFDEAVACLDRCDFDVIVTDIILAGKTGVDLLRTVHERGLKRPVIMITGDPNIETASEAVRLGAFDYLTKPVTGSALIRVVRLALDRNQLTQERDLYAGRMDQLRRELETIFNSVNEAIIMVDSQMRIRQVNDAARNILELTSRKMTDEPFDDVMPAPLAPARDALSRTLATRRAVADIRLEVSLDGGREKVLVVNTTPLVDETGAHGGAVLVARDITRLTLLERQVEKSTQYRNIMGKSAKMKDIFQLIEDLSETDSTVLICGESGTGKELIAAALHHSGIRSRGPFVRVNCAALSEDILESELFGHVKGAFTGAVKDRAGRFESASGGTILLDEIGDITPRLQLKLLRVLQEREFERVGESRPIRADVRVIAITNQDLVGKIRAGEFRQDLYYRLNVVRIEVAPLRERREDIPLLVDHFCRHFNGVFKKEVSGLAPETLEIFMNYPWMGNIRELENCIERAFIVCRDPQILPKHLPPEIRTGENALEAAYQAGAEPGRKGELTMDRIQEILIQTDWNIAKGARKLGIARNTLYQKMKAYGLARPRA